ncbi:MAG TPA: single-stranded-DNA-specific exonuclease RecJ [Burkholderiaceae bacterium]|nr:single-stranded-DNA-specific exonuclease RecJ [Burkholderiaceae bacterium]
MNVQLQQRRYDALAAQRLVGAGLLAPLARALAARGIGSAADLELAIRELTTPARLSQVDAAARLLADAIEHGRRMLIVADYDCDGATACAVGLRGLAALGARVDYLVPNRFETGYGLTPEIVDIACARPAGRPDLLITVDNGIASVAGVECANARGIDVLITDHHLPGEQLPPARVIVNPNQPNCGFPSKCLAGVGVMFYVLLALRAELRNRGRFSEATQPRLDAVLDLVALGTVADVVRLDRNNRILVAAGLERIRAGRVQPGIAALFQIAGRSARLAKATDLGFAIGPRINAAGRLADMTVGIECLTTDDFERALELAQMLDQLNRERRVIEADMQLDALLALDDVQLAERRTITLFDENWHQGVVGLVASRIKEKHHRPTIAFARADAATLRGSGRSIEGVHLRDTLDLVTKAAPALIDRFGGHAMAAGLTLRHDHLEGFTQAFEAATRASAEAALFQRTIETDGPLAAREISLALVEAIERQVWGQGFPPPLFDNEFTVAEQRLIKDQHLKLTLALGGQRFDAIWFRRTQMLPSRARLAYRPVVEEYQGLRRVTLMIEYAQG